MLDINITKISKTYFLSSNLLNLNAINNNNNNNILNNIRSKYVLKNIIKHIDYNNAFKIIKYNKNLQEKTGLTPIKIIRKKSQLIISSSKKKLKKRERKNIKNNGFKLIFKDKNKYGFDYYFELEKPFLMGTTLNVKFEHKYLLINYSYFCRNYNESIKKIEINLKDIFKKLNYIYEKKINNITYVENCYKSNITKYTNIIFSKENIYLNLSNMCKNMINLSSLIIKTNIPIKVHLSKYIFNSSSIKIIEGLKNLDFSESIDNHFINSNEYLNNKNIPDELLK